LCLTDAQALKLARLAVKLEDVFGGPRDIEFALLLEKEEVYLLQARPITAISAWTDEDLLHEFDSAVSSASDDVWSTANVGEVLSGALSPLTQSLVLKTLDLGIQARLQSNPVNQLQYNP
jgi:pyruvate,water dikinase